MYRPTQVVKQFLAGIRAANGFYLNTHLSCCDVCLLYCNASLSCCEQVCQIWLRLFEAEAVPLSRHHQLLELAVGRLHDKSLHVRKFALQVVTAFLEKHQFVAQVSTQHTVEREMSSVILHTLTTENKKYVIM